MMKTICFVLLIAAVVLSGCASAATQTPTPSATSTASQQVEVIWYVRSNPAEQQWQQAVVIPGFEKQNPHIKINLIVVPTADFDTRMQSMIDAGTPPDVWSLWGPSNFRDYVNQGLVADLTPFIQNDGYDLSDFEATVLDIYRIDGRVMGLPMLSTGSFLFYNKDLFDRAGVDYPPTNWDDKSWTWAAFLEKCEALTNVSGDPAADVFGCNLALWPQDAYAWMWGKDIYPDIAYQTGFADEAYLDDPLVIDAFQARQDIVWKLHFMPTPAQIDAFGGGDIFETQKVAMHLTGGWGWWTFTDVADFEWAVAALPFGADNRRDVLFTDPWLLSSQSRHPQEAWAFLKHLASPEVQRSWMERTGTPPARKSLAEEWYRQFPSMTPEEVQEVHLGALQYGRESPHHMLVDFNRLNQVVSSAVDPITAYQKQASEILPEGDQKLEEALRQIQAEYRK